MSCSWFHPSLRPQLLCLQLHLSSLLYSITLLILISSSYSASSHNSRGLVQQENDPNTRYLCKGPLGEYAACQCDEEEHEVACINAQFVDTGVFQYINSHYSSVARVTFHGNNFQDLPDEPLFGETTYTNLNVLNISANYIVNLHRNALKAVPNIKILDLSNNEIVLAEDNINFLMHTPKLTHAVKTMSHFFCDPNKRVDFVRATTNELSDQLPSTSYQSRNNFTGEQAKEFYESLVLNEEKPSSQRNYRTTENTTLSSPFRNFSSTKSRSEKPVTLTDRDFQSFLKASAEGDLASVKLYCRRGIDIEVEDMFHWTALMCAAAAGQEIITEFLLKCGANADQMDCSGRTAASLAQQNGHFWVERLIKKHSSDKNEDQLSDSMNKKCQLNEGFCNVCQSDYTGDNHEASMIHMIHSGQLPSEGYSYGISQSNRGYRMLKSGGWSEKLGLGKNSEGRKYPIKTILKRDTKGLGMPGSAKSTKRSPILSRSIYMPWNQFNPC